MIPQFLLEKLPIKGIFNYIDKKHKGNTETASIHFTRFNCFHVILEAVFVIL